MSSRLVSVALVVLFAAATLVPARPVDPRRIQNDLKQIALAYHNCVDATGKGPAKAADLGPYLENDKRLLGLLESKDIVLHYGYKITDITGGTSNTIMAYDKDAPSKGGYVAMFDGSVRKMTPEEFKKAKMPPKK